MASEWAVLHFWAEEKKKKLTWSREAMSAISGINGAGEAPDHAHADLKQSLNAAGCTLNAFFGA